jgi:hypothetical protein
MDIINIEPVPQWAQTGVTQANTIHFGDSVYNFKTGELSVNYQLHKSELIEPETGEPFTAYQYVAGGNIGVPKSIVDTWETDSTITDYVISQLGLTKI